MNAKRGYVPEDDRNFSPSALETLRTASRHISFLINEGYDLKQASTFVGNHLIVCNYSVAIDSSKFLVPSSKPFVASGTNHIV